MESSDRDSDRGHASTIFYEPTRPLSDIFFVHGLSGHPVRSWRHENKCVWPRDVLRNTDGFESSRIISLGYNSKIVGSGATSQSISDHARGMLADIRRFRSKVTGRPILFVAHDIGGNILKEVLITSFYEDVPEGENIARNTTAIVFFATPQRGATILNNVYTYMQIVRFLGLRTAKRLVKQLRPGSDYLYEASIRFNDVLKVVPIRLFSFYSTHAAPVWFQRKNSPSRVEVSIGNPNEQCLSLEGTPANIQKMSGSQDPNFERVLGLIRPMVQPPFLPRPLGKPGGSIKSAPNTKPPDVELQWAIEHNLLRLVVTEWSWSSKREEIDVPLAALIDMASDENVISHAFVAENLPRVDKNIDRITLTFRPASGGGAQTRHFRVLDVPHPMILGAGGVYSGQGLDKAIKGDIHSGTDSGVLPAEEEHPPTAIQNTDAQQVTPRVVLATSNQQPIASLPGESNAVSIPVKLREEHPVSSIQTISKNTSPGFLASSGELARTVKTAAEASSPWGPSTGIALGGATMGALGAGTAMYSATVARGAKAQAVRSADIAQQGLDLNRDIFEHTKRKDAAAAAAAAATNTNGVPRPSKSDSDSDSDDADSGVGGSSSKSTSLRANRPRANIPSAITWGRETALQPGTVASQGIMGDGNLNRRLGLTYPSTLPPRESSAPRGRLQPHNSRLPAPRTTQELDILFPAVPTHTFGNRPQTPENKPLLLVDGSDTEMDVLPSSRVDEVLVESAERPQPGVHATSHGTLTAQAPGRYSSENAQANKEERQSSITMGDNSIIDALPIDSRSDGNALLEFGNKAGAAAEVDRTYGATDYLKFQHGSTSTPDEQKLVQEIEPEVKPQIEALALQSEDQRIFNSPVADLRQGLERIPPTSTQVAAGEQDDPGTFTYQERTGEVDGKKISFTDPDPSEKGKERLLISASDEDMSHESAKKDEQRSEVEDMKSREIQIERDESAEDAVEESKAENQQSTDPVVNANSKDGEEPTITAAPEASQPSPHQLGRARTI